MIAPTRCFRSCFLSCSVHAQNWKLEIVPYDLGRWQHRRGNFTKPRRVASRMGVVSLWESAIRGAWVSLPPGACHATISRGLGRAFVKAQHNGSSASPTAELNISIAHRLERKYLGFPVESVFVAPHMYSLRTQRFIPRPSSHH